MKILVYYLLQVIAVSGILYGYYHFFLRNKKFHRYNRFYLLASLILSIGLPFLEIPVYFNGIENQIPAVIETAPVVNSNRFEDVSTAIVGAPQSSSWFNWQQLPILFYLIISLVGLSRIILSIRKIRSIIKRNEVEHLDDIRFVNTNEPGTPFSFFRWLFWNREIELRSEKGEKVFRHEYFHIQQKHSWDVMFTALLTIFFWINPFLHLIKRELKTIHEFLADKFAIRENKKWEYAELLLMQALQTKHHLVHPFFHNQIKRRIAMITSSNKTSFQYLRKIMVLPVAFFVLAIFAFSYRGAKDNPVLSSGPRSGIGDIFISGNEPGPDKNPTVSNEKIFTVVIDAGHGGTDRGAVSADGIFEKDIVLAIAKKVKQLNEVDQVRIILSRDSDEVPGLKERSEFCNAQEADLLLSLHINTSPNPDKNGFDIFIPKNSHHHNSENRILGSIFMNYCSLFYPVEKSLKQSDKSILIIDRSTCPAILIECGYLSNPNDLAFIKESANQNKIAKTILQAIDQYILQSKSSGWSERKEAANDTIPKTIEDNKVFVKVEIEPSFPGGSEKWKEYLQRNLDVKSPLEKGAIPGHYTVVAQFVVDTEGNISDLRALTKFGYNMEDQVLNLIRKGPRWNPAIQNGRKVKAYHKQLVHFFVGVEAKKGFATIQSKVNNTLYVGIDNPLTITGSDDLEVRDIRATITPGIITGSDGKYTARVEIPGEVTLTLELNEKGTYTIIGTYRFQAKDVPQPTMDKVINEKPEISIASLKNIRLQEMLQLSSETQIVSCIFTMDLKSGDIVEIPNSGSDFNTSTKQHLANAYVGGLITLDNIRVRVDGREKKIPSRLYYVVN